ncbi:MAG: sel1 repeat family protein [Legionellaceae bacterium]|nr:sel1 repeat family protein [Legionellaceae bacterium]
MKISRMLFMILCLNLCSCIHKSNLTEGIENFRIQNYRNAFIQLKPLADKGEPDAEYAVGYMYYYGYGVVEDKEQAAIWIHRAADAGQAQARGALSLLGR